MNEDSTIDRETWKPTPAEMEAYLKRELELAGSNLRVLLATFRDSKTQGDQGLRASYFGDVGNCSGGRGKGRSDQG